MGLGLGASAGGGMAYKLLQDLLTRRFTEEQAALKQQNAVAGQQLGRDTLNEHGREFDTTEGRQNREFNTTENRLNSQFATGQPLRDAEALASRARAGRDEYETSPLAQQRDIEKIDAQGRNQRSVANIRQRDRYQVQDAYDPETHQPIKVRVDLDSGAVEPLRIGAGGVVVGKEKNLATTQQGEVANYEAVIGEGNRILDTLKKSGLDKDNNPLSARTRSFIAQKLKVADNDPVVDQLIQNVGYLQTVGLRGAAGNQRLTNALTEVFKPHLGDTESTGARLSVVLPEVIRQLNDRRSNVYRLAQVKDPQAQPAGNSGQPDYRKKYDY